MKQFIQITDGKNKKWIRAADIVTADAETDANSATLTLTYKVFLRGSNPFLGSVTLCGDLMQAAIEGLGL